MTGVDIDVGDVVCRLWRVDNEDGDCEDLYEDQLVAVLLPVAASPSRAHEAVSERRGQARRCGLNHTAG